MCVYNGERYLRKSIDSILTQTFNDFEFIIINDGSYDKSMKIITSFRDSRIKSINQKNIGLTKSLNKGIKISKGKFIARLDADEISLPTRLEKQKNILINHPEIGIVGSYCIDYYNINQNLTKTIHLPLYDKEIKREMIWNNPFVHGSVMIRKKAIETVGYYNESFKYVQDYELWARVAVSYKLQNIPTVLIKRMVTKTSITYNPLIMKERSLYAFKAHISVLKTLKMPIYYYIFVFKRFARCMLFNLDIVNQPIINKKDYLKSIFG